MIELKLTPTEASICYAALSNYYDFMRDWETSPHSKEANNEILKLIKSAEDKIFDEIKRNSETEQ
jgi:hypothetical protein